MNPWQRWGMLDIRVSIDDPKAEIFLDGLAADLSKAVRRGLRKAVIGVFREADSLLAGSAANTGGYPVPNINDGLKSHLDWLGPGDKITVPADDVTGRKAIEFKTGDMEAIVFDSAVYSTVIHDGRGSSAKFGPRQFLTGALQNFNRAGRFAQTIEAEIRKDMP